ncbi:Transient receptor potential channel [Echinococcus granulosus]|uniref:Transient receptor potential channel n=1 Tax=Echinococcus granulosus TaxID=6210 RepID=W6UP29_ECHGR|nr:Transient receptor potential channel [Echinococcus granulosus]EUB55179.1 Transient receptor potential channel [Echinococcus granulosus]
MVPAEPLIVNDEMNASSLEMEQQQVQSRNTRVQGHQNHNHQLSLQHHLHHHNLAISSRASIHLHPSHHHSHCRGKRKGSTFSSKSSTSSSSSSSSSSTSNLVPPTWIEQKITQLNCAKYVPAIRSPDRCGCGRFPEEHDLYVIRDARMDAHLEPEKERWQVKSHTCEVPTTAFGTVEFQGGPHPTKARVCLSSTICDSSNGTDIPHTASYSVDIF